MVNDNTNKVMALATVAMALSAATQAIVGFQQFSLNVKNYEPNWIGLAGVIVMGILVLVIFGVAWKAFEIQKQ